MAESSVRKIIAMGGGGFSMEPENTLLDEFVRDATGLPSPTVCFVPTASHDAPAYVESFIAAFSALGCQTTALRLWDTEQRGVDEIIATADAFYVGGGNTNDLLGRWREGGIDRRLREAYDRGKVMAGLSAGSLCWFDWGVTDAFGGLDPLRCLGWVPGSNCVHYDSEASRRPAFQQLVGEGRLPAGHACDDGAALVIEDERVQGAVSSRPDARAFRIERIAGRASEEALVPTFLGTGKKLVVRRAGVADVPGINAARRRSIGDICAKHYTTEQVGVWNRPLDETRLEALIRDEACWVVVMDGQVEGFGNLILSGDEPHLAEIKGLYLSPAAVGQGLGKRLLRGMERHAKEQDRTIIRLRSTLNAVEFYRARGFRPTGPQTSRLRHGVPLPHLPMEKALG